MQTNKKQNKQKTNKQNKQTPLRIAYNIQWLTTGKNEQVGALYDPAIKCIR